MPAKPQRSARPIERLKGMALFLLLLAGAVLYFGLYFVVRAAVGKRTRPPPPPDSPPRFVYTCRSCGAAVDTTDRLDGRCERCWADAFEAASERADKS